MSKSTTQNLLITGRKDSLFLKAFVDTMKDHAIPFDLDTSSNYGDLVETMNNYENALIVDSEHNFSSYDLEAFTYKILPCYQDDYRGTVDNMIARNILDGKTLTSIAMVSLDNHIVAVEPSMLVTSFDSVLKQLAYASVVMYKQFTSPIKKVEPVTEKDVEILESDTLRTIIKKLVGTHLIPSLTLSDGSKLSISRHVGVPYDGENEAPFGAITEYHPFGRDTSYTLSLGDMREVIVTHLNGMTVSDYLASKTK